MTKPPIRKKYLLVLLFLGLASLPAAAGVEDIISLLNTITSTIRGEIGKVLNAIQTVRNTKRALEEEVVWPVNQIKQAKSSVLQMRAQLTGLARSIESLPVESATLINPKHLESVLRGGQPGNLATLNVSFERVYGPVPPETDAEIKERNLADIDDAMASGSLKTAIVSDQAGQQMLRIADALEVQAAAASPGSAALITAQASVANLESQAFLQRMLAAELREEASRIAHDNAILKRNAESNRNVRDAVEQILTRP